jgi:hypothetical protein
MAVSATRTIAIGYTGDVVGNQALAAATNTASPGQVQIVTLASGNNTITVPSGGTTPVACTIVKPSANTTAITLKGVNGDTGIRLHDTDPDVVSIDDSVTTFVLHAAAEIAGVRLYYT